MTVAASIDALLLCVSASLLEAGHILAIEERGIATIDSEKQAVINLLMHRLPPHAKELAHLCHRQELARSLLLIEARASPHAPAGLTQCVAI
jgi:hypothetical protein